MRFAVSVFVSTVLVVSFAHARPPPPEQDPANTQTKTDDLEGLLMELLRHREQAVQLPIKMSDLLPFLGFPLALKRRDGKGGESTALFPIKMRLLHDLEAALFPIKMNL